MNASMIAFISQKLDMGNVICLNDNENYSFLKNDVMGIRVHKESSHDRHKVDIKELGTNEEYGFYCTVPSYV